MMRRYIRALSVLLLGWSCVASGFEAEVLSQGIQLYESGESAQAIRVWGASSAALTERSKKPEVLRQAGLAEALATIALTRQKDALAYEHWARAMQYFLRSGTTWRDEQERIRRRLTELGRRLATVNDESGPPRVSPDDLTLMSIEDNLNVTDFSGPTPGLEARTEEAPINVSRDYFARPRNEIERGDTGVAGRSRTGAPGAQGGNQGAATLQPEPQISRVIAPVVSGQSTGNETPTVSTVVRTVPRTPDVRIAGGRGVATGASQTWTQSIAKRGVSPVTPTRRTASPSSGQKAPTRQQANDREKPTATETESPREVIVRPIGERRARPESSVAKRASASDRNAGSTDAERSALVVASAAPVSRSRQANIPVAIAESETDSQSPGTSVFRGASQGQGLSEADRAVAQAAWRYFVSNRQSNTGLYNSVSGYTFSSTWGIASSLAAMISAEQLGIIKAKKFNELAGHFLTTLEQLPLYNGELPNREYDVRTGKMVDSRNRPSNVGSGWSAVDIGRLLVWLKVLGYWYPDFDERVRGVVGGWNFDRLTQNQQMNGVFFDGQNEHIFQEGRLGYEQYAALGLSLWQLALPNALDYDELEVTSVEGQTVAYDRRPYSFLTLEPFILGKLELDTVDSEFVRFLFELYELQKARFKQTAVLTAATEDALDREPWFAYHNIASANDAWICQGHNGNAIPGCQFLSTKAAMGLASIFDDEYSKQLRDAVSQFIDPRQGFFAGQYDSGEMNKALSVNTNAVVLEAMLYLHRGGRPFVDAP
ncbi:MAG: DUF3131 domain-containing protein [Pseudomonadota bacterium]